MRILHIGRRGNLERFSPKNSPLHSAGIVDLPAGLPVQEYLSAGSDADFLICDAIAPVPAELIQNMPNLRLIHSEGVAFNTIDLPAASACHVHVCNCRGMNASAVAEQTVGLMIGVLRDFLNNDSAVRSGRQITVKTGYMARGDLLELADCSVGLVGFGDIGRATAKLLQAHGVRSIFCCKNTPLSPQEESELGVRCLDLPAVLSESDIVSLHLPVNEATQCIADRTFFSQMREGSYFINTARGELVDDSALADALTCGKLKMAGLDTLSREPVQTDHPLLTLAPDVSRRILFSPHIAGITASSFRRGYEMIWEDIQAVSAGSTPKRRVNSW